MAWKNSLREFSPFEKIILLLFLALVGVVLSIAVLYALNVTFFNLPLSHLAITDLRSNPESILAAKLLQIASQFGLFILPALGFAYLTSKSIKSGLSFQSSPSIKGLLIAVASTLLAIPFINLLAQWNATWHLPESLEKVELWMRNMQTSNDQLMEVILVMDTTPDVLINILMMAILPALGEELIFRGIIQKHLIKWLANPHVAIFLTSVIFSAFHLQFLGFLSRLILGMVFGYLFYYSKSIWTAIIAHFTNNFLALVLAFQFGTEMSENSFENPFDITLVSVSTLAFVLSIILIWYNRKKLSSSNLSA